MTGRHPSTAEQVRGVLIIAGGLFITWVVAMCVVVL